MWIDTFVTGGKEKLCGSVSFVGPCEDLKGMTVVSLLQQSVWLGENCVPQTYTYATRSVNKVKNKTKSVFEKERVARFRVCVGVSLLFLVFILMLVYVYVLSFCVYKFEISFFMSFVFV